MKTFSLEIITLKELKEHLHLADLRSVKRYCLLNSIAILRDNGSRSAYVMRSDYEAARMREFIKMLKKRHGKDWLKAYQAHVDFDIELLSALQGASRKDQLVGNKTADIVSKTSENEQRFLNKLNNLSSNLNS